MIDLNAKYIYCRIINTIRLYGNTQYICFNYKIRFTDNEKPINYIYGQNMCIDLRGSNILTLEQAT